MAFPILKHLALNPQMTPYRVEKETRIDRPTVLEALKILAKVGLVRVARRKTQGKGLVNKYYVTTPQGVVGLLLFATLIG
jgi:DNA-binding PadR family transcriptional regulator